ncbi:hypothetical protein GCM10022248_91600 [Nonomuraea soli]
MVDKLRRMRRAPQDKQRDAERTKARILEAAVEEFGAKGFAGARVSEIAARAGINKQLISYYFGGKEGLYQHVVAQWRGHESAFAEPGQDLGTLIASYVRANAANPDFGRLMVWEGLGEAPPDPAFVEEMRRNVDELRQRQEAGELPGDVDPGAAMIAMFAMSAAGVVFPQLAQAVTGLGREEFGEFYAEQMARLVGAWRTP